MDVAACLERFDEGRITRQVREKPELDLRIIGSQQQPARTRNESPPYVPAQLTTNRNVLQIRIVG